MQSGLPGANNYQRRLGVATECRGSGVTTCRSGPCKSDSISPMQVYGPLDSPMVISRSQEVAIAIA